MPLKYLNIFKFFAKTFNSLFEMLYLDLQAKHKFTGKLAFNSLFEMRSQPVAPKQRGRIGSCLSILYLRCDDVYDLCKAAKEVKAFNSLFEMHTAARRRRTSPCQAFQFSI